MEWEIGYYSEDMQRAIMAFPAGIQARYIHLTQRMLVGAAGPVALIFLDVDRLKALNSILGHVSGDQYLKTLTHRPLCGRSPSPIGRGITPPSLAAAARNRRRVRRS